MALNSGIQRYFYTEEAGGLSIQIFPYKLTQGALEARLATGETVLPGQLLRFDELPFTFGEVSEVQALPDSVAGLPEGHNVKITLLRGTPSLKPTCVTPLSAQEMVTEVVQLLPTPEYPVDFGTFRSDYLRFGPFTLVEGPNFLLKYQALLAMMEAVRPYQKMLILDPVGVFESVGDIACYQAGETVRLSLQEVSIRRFLDAFGSLFPEGIRKPVTEAVASHWPASGTFSGFSPLLVSGMITESLLKNIILQNCAHVIRNKLFAEAPGQVLDLKVLAKNRVSVLDLSLLQEPWKSFFYQEAMAQVFATPELGLTPVLIYPENYLPDLSDWIQRADETDRHMLAVASNYGPATVRQWASNLVSVRPSQLPVVRGDLTVGLPVAFGEPADWLEPLPVPQPIAVSLPPENSDLPPLLSNTAAPVAHLPEASFSSVEVSPLASEAASPELSAILSEAAVEIAQPDVSVVSLAETLPGTPSTDVAAVVAMTSSLEQSPEMPDLFSERLPEATLETSASLSLSRELSEEISEPTSEEAVFSSWQKEGLLDLTFPEAEPPETQSDLRMSMSVEETSERPSEMSDTTSESVPFVHPPPMPVVDLSGTVLEESPGFLSLEQLSELLNAPEPLAKAIEQTADPLDYPDAEEGAIPDEMGDASNFPPPALSTLSDEALQMPAVEALYESPEIVEIASPTFPEPEAYASDEFDFDLNLDQKVEQLFEPVLSSSASTSGSSLGSRIAKSLDRFEESPAAVVSGPSLATVETTAHPQASVQEVTAASGISTEPMPVLEDANLQVLKDSLDLLYPPMTQGEGQAEEALSFGIEESAESTESSYGYEEVPVLPVAPKEVLPVAEMAPVSLRTVESPSMESRSFQVGDKVRHPQYGLGIVQKVIPVEQSMILNITFEAVGKRLLDPALTQLTLASSS